jgi:hypothetical protein
VKPVNVESSRVAGAAIRISETGYIPAPHKNKWDKDYPPVIDDSPAYPSGHETAHDAKLLTPVAAVEDPALHFPRRHLLFALTGWIVLRNAVETTTSTMEDEVGASFQAYQSLWKARAELLVPSASP